MPSCSTLPALTNRFIEWGMPLSAIHIIAFIQFGKEARVPGKTSNLLEESLSIKVGVKPHISEISLKLGDDLIVINIR